MDKKIAVFPGSFDPLTIGHEALIKRALPLFDKIILAIGHNPQKKTMFSLEKRKEWATNVFSGIAQVEVEVFEGLTVDFCKRSGARYILRGLRSTADFEFEKAISQMNLAMAGDIETVFLITSPELSAINSTIIRDIVRNNGNAAHFVPSGVNLRDE